MKTARAVIRQAWRDADPAARTVGSDLLQSLIKEIRKRGQRSISIALKNHLEFLDEYISWFVSLAVSLNFSKDDIEYEGHMSYRLVIGAICSFAYSIRNLIVSGQDLAAKQVLRSLGEYSDLFLLMLVNTDVAIEFHTEDFDVANRFWHKHIRSNKARKHLWNVLCEETIQEPWIREFMEWRRQEDTVLSLSAHPSFVASFMAVVPVLGNPDDIITWPAFLGHVSDMSIRTITYTIDMLFMIAASSTFPFEETKTFKPLLKFDEGNRFHYHIEKGRNVLIEIEKFLSGEGANHPNLKGTAWWQAPTDET